MDNQQVMRQEYEVISKRGTLNLVRLFENFSEVFVYNRSGIHVGTVLLDLDVVENVVPLRVSSTGYAYLCVKGALAIHHIVMEHISNMETVIDHINGNPLDNRRINLRVVSAKDNANNRTRMQNNNTGVIGIIRRKHPIFNYEYYRATVSDRSTPMGGAKSKTRQISKHFNINKYGECLAFALAKEWLDAKKLEFGYLS